MQETVKAAASYFYANRSVFDAGRLRFQGFAAETQISNEIGGTDMRTTKFNMKDFGLRLRKLRQGHPTIVDYFYHEEVRGTANSGKRNRKTD